MSECFHGHLAKRHSLSRPPTRQPTSRTGQDPLPAALVLNNYQMVAVRSALLKTVALTVALFASKAVAQTTTQQPASAVSTTTAPAWCSNATLKFESNHGVISCNGTRNDTIDLGTFTVLTELTVVVEPSNFTVESIATALISKLYVHTDSVGGLMGQLK